jgi:hypothetical protein
MTFSTDTQRILEQVEQLTEKPVYLQADPALPTLATVRVARGDAPAHLVTYRPDAQGVDYALASQFGSVLRIHQTPPEDRADLVTGAEGRESVRRSLAGPNGTLTPYKLPDAVVKQATDSMFDGLMTQLRSLPIEMRVGVWLREAYPGLRAAQEQYLAAEMTRAAQSLAPQVRDMTPPTVFSANAAMNAAFALFCDRLLGRPLYTVAFQSTGLADRGQLLLDLWDRTPADASYDRALVDAWGDDLGLSDWYSWVPWQ